MMNGNYASPSSSPPSTPPSPLPVSVGPGRQNYFFSSPSPSPPFSPLPSNHASAERLPLLHNKSTAPLRGPSSAFSLDRPSPDESDSKSSCLKDLLVWLVLICCKCSLSSRETQPPHIVDS